MSCPVHETLAVSSPFKKQSPYNSRTQYSPNTVNVFGTGIPLRGHSDVSQWPDNADYSCVQCFRDIRCRAVHGFWTVEFSNGRLGASH
jgi:hypothetical protein